MRQLQIDFLDSNIIMSHKTVYTKFQVDRVPSDEYMQECIKKST
jgi:hypothetical protein